MLKYILFFIYFYKGFTDFGVYIEKKKMFNYFNDDPK